MRRLGKVLQEQYGEKVCRLSGYEPLPVFAGRFGLMLRSSPWKYRSIPCSLRLASAQICSAETAKHL